LINKKIVDKINKDLVNKLDIEDILSIKKIIENAGHHVYGDQPEIFNSYVRQILHSISNIN
jgi:pimeloyl-ACP methyl ester carboxylesterase